MLFVIYSALRPQTATSGCLPFLIAMALLQCALLLSYVLPLRMEIQKSGRFLGFFWHQRFLWLKIWSVILEQLTTSGSSLTSTRVWLPGFTMHVGAVEDDRILQEVITGSLRRLCTIELWAFRRPDIRGNANQFISRSVTYVCKSQAFPRHSPCENKRRYLSPNSYSLPS